ncbi:uncharacterized protein LOC141712047 isoform X2 [Apium graveolens]|uniref:uncharacterized protein LOC141712047 isoform X2 n=1 Tax=Apium graveolens TaxID=4045 RepID=UPI003D7B3C6C
MKSRKSKRAHIEVIPENAVYEENIRSFGDETPSDDTGEQEEISVRKRKKSGTGSTSSSKEKESEVTNEQGDKQTEEVPKPYTKRPRKKTSAAWKFLEEFEQDGEKWARCKLCHQELKRGPTSSTSSLNRHVDKCKIIHGLGLQKQAQLQFQPGQYKT